MEKGVEMQGDLQVAKQLTVKQTWLHTLLKADLFEVCKRHDESKHNKKSIYCIDCQVTMCRFCHSESRKYHQHHNFFQALMLEGKIVLQAHEIESLVDISNIPVYKRTHAPIVYLKSQKVHDRSCAQAKSPKEGRVMCRCRHIIEADNRFCSLDCKVSECRHDEIYRCDISESSTSFEVGVTWLHSLLDADLNNICKTHVESPDNKKMIFCITCELMLSLCCHMDFGIKCRNHKFLHSIMCFERLAFQHYEMERLIDCSNILIRRSFGADVILVKPLADIKSVNGKVKCKRERCMRFLPEGILYCSLFCKVAVCGADKLYRRDDSESSGCSTVEEASVSGIGHQSVEK